MESVRRVLDLGPDLNRKSVLLLGPRRTGKSFYLRNQLKPDAVYDLLKADVFRELSARPELIRERLKKSDRLIVIDEIQKLPLLMDEVHGLIESNPVKFLLTGSSAKKLRRNYTSLMAGRAAIRYIHPFCFPEIQDNFDLARLLDFGSLPPILFSSDPLDDLKDYVGTYIKEEVQAEALVRRIDNFSRFVESAARSNGEILNFESIGSDAQVSARTIREYYQVLEDTLLGSRVEPVASTKSRKSVATSKFYFFDIGVVNTLCGRGKLSPQSEDWGRALEHLIYLELAAYRDYKSRDILIQFWNSPREGEVDFIINNEIAIEVKATRHLTDRHLKSLKLFSSSSKPKHQIVICNEPHARKMGAVQVLPVQDFLEKLWSGKLLK